MERLTFARSVFAGAFVAAVMLLVSAGMGYAQDNCTSQEGISCTERCGPTKVSAVEAGGVEVVEMAESQQVNMLAGRATDFTARCEPGYAAIGGGYVLVPEGSTINMKEVGVTSTLANNNDPSGWTGWKVSVFRKAGAGAPDNCLKVEVHAYCVKGR